MASNHITYQTSGLAGDGAWVKWLTSHLCECTVRVLCMCVCVCVCVCVAADSGQCLSHIALCLHTTLTQLPHTHSYSFAHSLATHTVFTALQRCTYVHTCTCGYIVAAAGIG